MSESEYQISKIKLLLEAYISLIKLHCESGVTLNEVFASIKFVKEQIRKACA